ncbi:MAG: DUF2892 domain-containing protein [Anaerolineaceae bacterium]|nr:DUF2892 domain-containing protein [Anaerolineaceae bacterium]
MAFAKFMSGPIGRGIRILAGIVVLALGLGLFGAVDSPLNIILDVVGVFLIAVGAFNICVFAPLFGGPLMGKDVK